MHVIEKISYIFKCSQGRGEYSALRGPRGGGCKPSLYATEQGVSGDWTSIIDILYSVGGAGGHN